MTFLRANGEVAARVGEEAVRLRVNCILGGAKISIRSGEGREGAEMAARSYTAEEAQTFMSMIGIISKHQKNPAFTVGEHLVKLDRDGTAALVSLLGATLRD